MKVDRWMWTWLGLVSLAAAGCQATGGYNAPPAERLMHPGPGVGGPGPGVMMMPSPSIQPVSYEEGGMVDASGGSVMAGDGSCLAGGTNVQVLFADPNTMQVHWDVSGSGTFDSVPLVTPARQNFSQGGIYRLKLTHIPGREGIELYPTLELGPQSVRTSAYLAHNAIPVQFTEEDLDQAMRGNFVTKVIYLPDPEFQELALAGIATLVSTRLDPGVDPIVEADRRGAILAVVRLGNKDLETPGFDHGYSDGESMPVDVTHASYQAQGAAASGMRIPVATHATHEVPTADGGLVGGIGSAAPCADGACAGGEYAGGACADGMCGTGNACYGNPWGAGTMPSPPGGMPNGLLAAAPQYGMPYVGTPIGLPGPPHIPLGAPAGLKRHVIKNHTRMFIPRPTEQVKINVKQRPGLSYPIPADRAWVVEDTIHPHPRFGYKHFTPVPGGQQMICR